MALQPESPEWWLERLYKQLRERRRFIADWDAWYIGDHPAPAGYEKAGPVLLRLLETVGLNVLATVTDAALERQHVEGFKINGRASDDLWSIWQANKFDLGSEQVFQEKMALSASYILVDPNSTTANGSPVMTAEHPDQCIVEKDPASGRRRAGLKVWQDDVTRTIEARVYLPESDENGNDVFAFSAPTRATVNTLAIRPGWERQADGTGSHELGEVPLVPFYNRPRLLRAPVPEFYPAIRTQRRINKTLLDRMSMQDAGAFKAKWATGVDIPTDPATQQPVEPFKAAIDRMFVATNEKASFGQFDAEDIAQILQAVKDDVMDAAILVPTPPDQILGQMVNVSADGLKSAQASLISRVKRSMRHDEEPLEDVGVLALRAAGKDSPNDGSMTTVWRNPEFRTEGEMAQAGVVALAAGVPHEAVWERYFNATPDEVKDWNRQLDQRASREAAVGVRAVRDAADSGV